MAKSILCLGDIITALLGSFAGLVHTHGLSDITSGGTAGATVQVNAAGNALESAFPLYADIGAGAITLTTTPAVVLTLNLPAAGTYYVSCIAVMAAATVTGTRTTTLQWDMTNFTSCAIATTKYNSGPIVSNANALTTNPLSHTLGLSTNQRGDLRMFGKVTVSAASVLTITGSVSGDTISLMQCANITAQRIS